MPAAIELASPHELLPALRLLFPLVAELSTDALDGAGVFVSRDASGRVCAATMVQLLSGALGVAWPPSGATPEVEDALVVAGREWLRRRGVKVCQTFATAEEAPRMAALERNGFRHITQLVSLNRAVGAVSFRSSLAFEPQMLPFSEVVRETLLVTNEGTLDCPELNGTRTAEELLAGFTELLPGSTWHIARLDGAPVGVVMLATGAEEHAVDLAYLGVAPRARGRGFGRELAAFALAEAAHRGGKTLAVAVDARNEPALKLYARHGFEEFDRREVWLAHFIGPEKADTTSS